MRTTVFLLIALAACKQSSEKSITKAGPAPVAGKADRENLPPQIKRVGAKAARIGAGTSTEVSATIVDPENDPFHAWWTSSCGIVVAKSDAPDRATFLAPTTPGPCAVTLEVQDHEMKRGHAVTTTIVVEGA